MLTTHPYIPLADRMSPAILQGCFVQMVIAVVLRAAFDLMHGQKIRFFLQASGAGQGSRDTELGAGVMAGGSIWPQLRNAAMSGLRHRRDVRSQSDKKTRLSPACLRPGPTYSDI